MSTIKKNSLSLKISSKELKKKYQSPSLLIYGSIAKLTQSVGSANGDGGQNMMA